MRQVLVSDEISSRLPADDEEANQLINEILEQAFYRSEERPEDLLENRPEWQEKIRTSRQQWASGQVVQHEEVVGWMTTQRPSK